eukprot:CAMPEP_0174861192 /NCGR_PEP_ID=MMETSP1114-20130205/51020_1 /TAXON_ID=312471 /ORGANISM="Neobodo designis, Strain CCAP 1951/1" /LENGTH=180 /DNA_ID=CAMNT_0016096195 /DNA_START=29 /DNA_END=567 /DNA_ORIENTATION=+
MPPLKVEYAKSSRAVCSLKECGKAIEKGSVRIGTGAMMPGVDELRFKWRHLCCFTARQLASVSSVDSIEGYEDLAPEDQALVRRMVKKELIGDASVMKPSASAAMAPSPSKKPRAEAAGAPDAEPAVSGAAAAAAVATELTLPIGADGKRICPHGTLCFRIDPPHFAQCSHNTGPHAAVT